MGINGSLRSDSSYCGDSSTAKTDSLTLHNSYYHSVHPPSDLAVCPSLLAAISCRKEHRTSPVAHFAPGFDAEGSPISRSGYMVGCLKHSDCYKCGRHPLTDQVRLDLSPTNTVHLHSHVQCSISFS